MPPKRDWKRKLAAKLTENALTGAKSAAPVLTEANSEAESTKDASVDASLSKKSKQSRSEQSEEGVIKSDGSKATTQPSGRKDQILQDATQEHGGDDTKSANDETIETNLQGEECNTGIDGGEIIPWLMGIVVSVIIGYLIR